MKTKKDSSSVELARYFDANKSEVIVTIETYLKFVENQNKEGIAEFLFQRLHSRYLKPFQFENAEYKEHFKNGFSIMANCCLLIETIQSFINGWGDSYKKSERAFKEFFQTDQNFSELKANWKEVYVNVRCGILHQGETTGGWKVNRLTSKLFDPKTQSLSAILFAQQLEKSLTDYKLKLLAERWDSETWDNLRVKMRSIISNCASN